MHKNTTLYSNYLFVILAQIMGGINVVGAKYLINNVPLLFILALRFALAAIILLILHLLSRPEQTIVQSIKQLKPKPWAFIVAQALSAGVLFNVFMLWGLHYTKANVAGIITSALPAMVIILAWIFLKEQLTVKKWLCVGCATAGLIIVNVKNLHGIAVERSLLGSLLVLIALLPEACYYLLTKLYNIKMPVFLLSALINAINAAIVLPLMLAQMDWSTLNLSLTDIMVLLAISLGSGLFYVFWSLGIKKISPAAASLSTALMPIATVVIAALFLQEQITLLQCLGMVFIIVSIVICAKQ